jgi:hypothetical protein
MKNSVRYGVRPSSANAPSRDYELSLISVARNCLDERAIIEVMTHEVIYPLQGKGEQPDPTLPKDRRRKHIQNKYTNR